MTGKWCLIQSRLCVTMPPLHRLWHWQHGMVHASNQSVGVRGVLSDPSAIRLLGLDAQHTRMLSQPHCLSGVPAIPSSPVLLMPTPSPTRKACQMCGRRFVTSNSCRRRFNPAGGETAERPLPNPRYGAGHMTNASSVFSSSSIDSHDSWLEANTCALQ
jgi:hypothetical protein